MNLFGQRSKNLWIVWTTEKANGPTFDSKMLLLNDL
jgi:hypothetical protein